MRNHRPQSGFLALPFAPACFDVKGGQRELLVGRRKAISIAAT